ncbi:MAG: FAD binding domain-containing protein [Spirochaetota bacterium]
MVEGYRPADLNEALEIRKTYGAIPFSGGTDLMVRYRSTTGTLPKFPSPVVYLAHLSELQGIEKHAGQIVIRSAATLEEIARSPEVPALLAEAVRQMAAPALRNIATAAGNVCNASPAGDALCALYALDASVELTSLRGKRTVPIDEFITGPGVSVLDSDELLTAMYIPDEAFTFHFYRKVGTRKANALSKLSVCGIAKISGSTIHDARIAFGAVGPTVVRSRAIEKMFFGEHANGFATKSRQIRDAYEKLIKPIDDQRSTAAYRKHTSLSLLDAFINQLEKELLA